MEGALQTPPVASERPRALAARTMCEAFQITAAERADQVALRTLGDGVTVTFAQYAARVAASAGALHALRVSRAHAVGFMLSSRPGFRPLDGAAMRLGAAPFSIYN